MTLETGSDALRRRVSERCQAFDVQALRDVLHWLGYSDDDIVWVSNKSLGHRSSVVEAVDFFDRPEGVPAWFTPMRPLVRVTVNLGLLYAQSPLPGFFFAKDDRLDDEALADALRFFDGPLLRERFENLYPETWPALFPDWESSSTARLELLRLTTPATLHWLMSLSFPEMEVAVRRTSGWRSLVAEPVVVGQTSLGGFATLLGVAAAPRDGLEVLLHVGESDDDFERPWAAQALKRLAERVLPLLERTALHLTVLLKIRELRSRATLGPNGRAQLGWDALEGGTHDHWRVVLFAGDVRRWREFLGAPSED